MDWASKEKKHVLDRHQVTHFLEGNSEDRLAPIVAQKGGVRWHVGTGAFESDGVHAKKVLD
jgi:hypothetical protein